MRTDKAIARYLGIEKQAQAYDVLGLGPRSAPREDQDLTVGGALGFNPRTGHAFYGSADPYNISKYTAPAQTAFGSMSRSLAGDLDSRIRARGNNIPLLDNLALSAQRSRLEMAARYPALRGFGEYAEDALKNKQLENRASQSDRRAEAEYAEGLKKAPGVMHNFLTDVENDPLMEARKNSLEARKNSLEETNQRKYLPDAKPASRARVENDDVLKQLREMAYKVVPNK